MSDHEIKYSIIIYSIVRRLPEPQLDGPVCQLPELVDVLVQCLVGEEVVPLAPLEHDPDVPVAVLEPAAVPAGCRFNRLSKISPKILAAFKNGRCSGNFMNFEIDIAQ